MTPEQKLAYKIRLIQFCEDTITRRMAVARQAMDNAQASANSEEKSSAGDKYETGRAISHLEKDMYARQLMANAQELNALRKSD